MGPQQGLSTAGKPRAGLKPGARVTFSRSQPARAGAEQPPSKTEPRWPPQRWLNWADEEAEEVTYLSREWLTRWVMEKHVTTRGTY